MAHPIYHAEPWNAHRVAALPDMTLLYHQRSGETHFLAAPLPDLLGLLGEAADDADGLTRRLCERLDLSVDDEAIEVVRHRLDELAAAGLVWVS